MRKMNWTRRLMTCVVSGMVAASMMAVPAYRGWRTVTQPDGTQIEVRQMGDEFYHYWETKNGKIVEPQDDGTFLATEKAKPDHQQWLRQRKASSMYPSKPRKAIGERNLAPRGLVILVQFKDIKFKSENTKADFQDMMNKAGYNYNGATGSAVDYFKAQSNNDHNPVFDVIGPVTLKNEREYYGAQGKIGGYDQNDMYIADFVVDAVLAADELGCDFSQYDADNDKKVDIVYFIYAGQGQADGGATETIWPHNWELSSAFVYKCTHGGSGYSSSNLPKLDNKTINNYACSGELNGDEDRSGIGTFCHEFSHVLGLPDYYDTSEDEANNGLTPNDWSLMDYGSYLNDGMTPPNYSMYDKYFMGWATPKLLKKDEKATVSLTTGYDDAYQINGSTSILGYDNAKTIYYIENRQKSGWDAYLPGHGMLVWQVKYSDSKWSENEPNATANNPRYTLISASGKELIGDVWEKQGGEWVQLHDGSTDPFPYGETNSYKPYTGCELTEISESAAGVITFKYNGGQVKEKCTYELLSEYCTVPADGELATNSVLSLTITPDAGYTLADASCWNVSMGTTDLVYGKDFTYNATTNEFRIEKVTDDVVILATGKKSFEISWFSKGTEFTKTVSAGTIVMPASDPAGCGDGKVFVGWCKIAEYTDASAAPTFIKDGETAVEGDKFYAVFATETAGGETSWEKASAIAVGDEVVLVYETGKMEMTSFFADKAFFGKGTAYTTTPTGDFSFNVVAGKSAGTFAFERKGEYWCWEDGNTLIASDELTDNSSWKVTFSSGNAVIKNASDDTRSLQWNAGSPRFACYTSAQKAVQLYKKIGGGTSYSDYTTTCAPCDKKITVAKGTATNGSFALDQEGEIETCGAAIVIKVKDITPAEGYKFKEITQSGIDGAVIDQTAKTVTFAKGSTGTSTINVTFEEKSKFTVRFFDRGEKIDEQQILEGEKATAPTLEPVCSGFTFVGWWTAELDADNTEAKTWVTDFEINAAKDFYAIYSRTAGGGLSNKYQKITDLSDLTTGNYVVAGNDSKALKNSVYNDYYMSTTTVNPSNNVISDPAATIIWKITRTDNMVSLYNEKVSKYVYLYQSGTFYDLGLQNDAYNFKVSVSGGSWKFEASDYAGQYMVYFIYNSNVYEFAAKSSTSNSIYLYKQQSTATTYYSSSVDCSLPTAIINTNSDESAAVKALRNGQIVIIRGEAVYSITGTRLQ